jgi:hypothetical protein
MSATGGFVVVGRPPGTITYSRRMRADAAGKNCVWVQDGAGQPVLQAKLQQVTRRRARVSAHQVPYHSRAAADEVLRRVAGLGWTDLEIRQDGRPVATTRTGVQGA